LIRSTRDRETILAELAARPELLENPIAIAAERTRAVVARPPELALCLLIPEAPAGVSESDLMRRLVQG
jgi:hypothetical protein